MYSQNSFKGAGGNFYPQEDGRRGTINRMTEDEERRDIHPSGYQLGRSNPQLDQFGKQKSNMYSVIISSDIIDPYLRASFEGDTQAVIQHQYKLQKSLDKEKQAEELWNKSLLGFFLSLQNNQIKTANTFYKKYKLLRIIIWKLINVYEQNVNPNKKYLDAKNQYSYKTKKKEDLQDQSLSSADQESTKKKGSDHTSKSNGKNSKQPSINQYPVLDFDSEKNNIIEITTQKRIKTESRHVASLEVSIINWIQIMKDFELQQCNSKRNNSDEKVNNDKNSKASDIPSTYFKTMHEANKMKTILKSDLAISFNSNLLKIALNLGEDRIAALIVARFPIQLDEQIIKFSVQQRNLIFLHNIFFYNKSILAPTKPENSTESEEDDIEEDKLRVFYIEDLLKMVHSQFDFHDAEQIMSQIMSWKFDGKGNILKLLCDIGHERIAARFMENYYQFSDFEFFFDCVVEEKQYFLKNALRNQYFDSDYMHSEELTDWVMKRLKSGKNLLYPLNLLLFTDFRKWTLQQLHDFSKVAELVITPNLETNYMLITYNPIMTLGLMIEYLSQIKLHFNYLDSECTQISRRLETLGRIILESMQFDDVEQTFLEKDFKDRSVLQIVTESKIMGFIVKNKLKFLLDKIWEGKDSQMIDGKTKHFSRTEYLLNHEVKQLKGVEIKMGDMLGNNFKPNIEDYNFTYQKKFREESIFVIFTRDFLNAALLVTVFQYVNYSYLSLFNQRRYENATTYDETVAIVTNNLQTYRQINQVGTILSVSYFFSFGGRVIYNYAARRKIDYDIWVLFDLASGVINILAFNVIGNAKVSQMLNQQSKWWLDYYMIVVLIIAWLRFFSYFLVISYISKATITLFKMMWETVSFLIILMCYLILMTTVFATLFKDCNTPDAQDYQQLSTTLRDMIDYFFGNYPTKDMGPYNTSHSILYIIHVTFSNIFLLNYLVAILTTVYDIMIKNGDFYSIDYQYQFITKYLKAIDERNGYELFILIPPPMNYILCPLALFIFSRSAMKKFSRYYSNIIYWMENIILISCTIITAILTNPFIILKTYINIFKIDGSGFTKFVNFTLWTVFGLLFCLYLNLVDICMLFNILCLDHSLKFTFQSQYNRSHHGKQEVIFDNSNEEKFKLERHKYYIYRDIIRSFQQLNIVADHALVFFHQRQQLQRNMTDNTQSIKKKIKNSENDIKADDMYIIRKELVVSAYLQISNQNPYLRQYRQQYQSFARRQTSGMLYSSIDLNKEEIRQQLKENPEISDSLRMLVGRMMISNNKDDLRELIDFIEKDKIENDYLNITDDEAKILNSFINRYTIAQKNQEETTVNLQLVLKTFPSTFTPQHIQKIDMLHFQRMQKCLISFFNDDQDEMFNYYDGRMKRRLNSLKRNSNKNSHLIVKILDLTKFALDYIQWDEAVNKIRKEHSKRFSMVSSMNQPYGANETLKNDISSLNVNSPLVKPKEGYTLYQNPSGVLSSVNFQDFMQPQQIQQLQQQKQQVRNQTPESVKQVEEVEGLDFLMKEQQKNLQRMLSYKNKSQKQNQKQQLVEQQQSSTLLQVNPTVTIISAPFDSIVLPSADFILKQIRQKRKERMKKEQKSDDEDSSVENSSDSEKEQLKDIKNNTLRQITMPRRKTSKLNNIAHELDDSIHTDGSMENVKK